MSELLQALAAIAVAAGVYWAISRYQAPRPATPAATRAGSPAGGPTAAAGGRRVPAFGWSEREAPRITAELTADIRDGVTGAPLDPAQPVWRCTSCHTCYQEASRAVLAAENLGQCLGCGTAELERLMPSRPPAARATPVPHTTPARRAEHATDAAYAEGPITLTAHVWWVGSAADPGFYVAVLENKPWRRALKLIFPPAFSAQPGGAALVAGLREREVTVSGHLATNGPLGPRIIVTERRMIRTTSNPTHDRS